tara:strand:+ start:1252 stop:1695 length:444 start_codon:yes stop_codon:yes gene_type:complete
MKNIFIIIALVLPISSYAFSLFGSFEECVSEKQGGEKGFQTLYRCIVKYEEDLPQSTLKNIKGKAEMDDRNDKLKISYKNENADWRVTRIRVSVTIDGVSSEYSSEMTYAQPFERTRTWAKIRDVNADVIKDWSWRVVGGKGVYVDD